MFSAQSVLPSPLTEEVMTIVFDWLLFLWLIRVPVA